MKGLLSLAKAIIPRKKGARLLYRIAGFALVAFILLTIFNSLNAFIRPSDALSAKAEFPTDQFDYYCTTAALKSARAGQPVPSLCSLTLASETAAAVRPKIVHYDGDKYAWGNCTYWAALRRAQVGNPIPNTWGDATYWASRARRDGYTVNHTPNPGAIMQRSSGRGHVAFVESVSTDGTWRISEMNAIGFNRVDYRTLPASAAASYNFIH